MDSDLKDRVFAFAALAISCFLGSVVGNVLGYILFHAVNEGGQ